MGPLDRRHHVDRQFDALQLARSEPRAARRFEGELPRNDLDGPLRRLLRGREEVPRALADAEDAPLVQVAERHHLALRDLAARSRLLSRCLDDDGRSVDRQHPPTHGGTRQPRVVADRLSPLRSRLANGDRQDHMARDGAHAGRRRRCVGRLLPFLQRACRIHPRRCARRHDHDGQRLVRDPPVAARAHRGDEGGPRAGPTDRVPGQAAIGSQQLHHLPAALHHAERALSFDLQPSEGLAHPRDPRGWKRVDSIFS